MIYALVLALAALLNEHLYAGFHLRRLRHGRMAQVSHWPRDLEAANHTYLGTDDFDGDSA